MLRNYKFGDYTFQFEDGDVPEGAILIEPEAKNKKAPAKSNKSRSPRRRTRKAADNHGDE